MELLTESRGHQAVHPSCRFTGIALSYHCDASVSAQGELAQQGQLPSWRVDCRAAGPHFQNLTLHLGFHGVVRNCVGEFVGP